MLLEYCTTHQLSHPPGMPCPDCAPAGLAFAEGEAIAFSFPDGGRLVGTATEHSIRDPFDGTITVKVALLPFPAPPTYDTGWRP